MQTDHIHILFLPADYKYIYLQYITKPNQYPVGVGRLYFSFWSIEESAATQSCRCRWDINIVRKAIGTQ